MADRAAFAAIMAAAPGVAVKGKAMPYAALNGNMFAFLAPEGRICLRLSDTDRTSFASEHGAEPVIQHGAVLKSYVFLPEGMDPEAARGWARRAHDHAVTLKPKATRRG